MNKTENQRTFKLNNGNSFYSIQYEVKTISFFDLPECTSYREK